jgi:hypothetical protein
MARLRSIDSNENFAMISHGSSPLREALPAKPGNPRIRIEDEPPLQGKDILFASLAMTAEAVSI